MKRTSPLVTGFNCSLEPGNHSHETSNDRAPQTVSICQVGQLVGRKRIDVYRPGDPPIRGLKLWPSQVCKRLGHQIKAGSMTRVSFMYFSIAVFSPYRFNLFVLQTWTGNRVELSKWYHWIIYWTPVFGQHLPICDQVSGPTHHLHNDFKHVTLRATQNTHLTEPGECVTWCYRQPVLTNLIIHLPRFLASN